MGGGGYQSRVRLRDVSESAVGTLFGAVARVRGDRALHPRGGVRAGTVRRDGLDKATGVSWLDEPGTDQVLVRLSRGAGLPSPAPDLLGLAIRIPLDNGQVGDLLLTTTGRAPVLRHLMRPARDPYRAGYTSIVPFRTPTGLLMVGAFAEANPGGDTDSTGGFVLSVSSTGGSWRPFGYLDLQGNDAERRPDIDFDPVLHAVPGLELPGWLAHLRAPAYRASRQARH
jgi:hypothetical protein